MSIFKNVQKERWKKSVIDHYSSDSASTISLIYCIFVGGIRQCTSRHLACHPHEGGGHWYLTHFDEKRCVFFGKIPILRMTRLPGMIASERPENRWSFHQWMLEIAEKIPLKLIGGTPLTSGNLHICSTRFHPESPKCLGSRARPCG